MIQRWKVLTGIAFAIFWLGLVSWHDGYNPEYCEQIDDCTKHNVVVFGWLFAGHFTHQFESLFIVLFTAGLVLFTWQLRQATVGLIKATEQLGKDAELSASRQQRAWIGFKDTESKLLAGSAPNEYSIHFTFSSVCYGGSPAFNVEMFTQSQIVPPEEGIPNFVINSRDTPSGIMLPGSELSGDAIILDNSQLLDIQNGVRNWYVYHVSIYRTLLEPIVERKTETCSRITVIAAHIENGFEFNWISHTAGSQNSAT